MPMHKRFFILLFVISGLGVKFGYSGAVNSMRINISCFVLADGNFRLANGQKTWCVAKPSSDQATLLENINYACSQVDCKILQKGCACYSPDNLMNHASIAMNLYYQCKGRSPWNCHFGNSGLVSSTDPSYGGCTYE